MSVMISNCLAALGRRQHSYALLGLLCLPLAPPSLAHDPEAAPSPCARPAADEALRQVLRRRPGHPIPVLRYEDDFICDDKHIPPANYNLLGDPIPVPDRWRIVDSFYPENLYDPYNNNNPLKGDKPIWGEDWFFSITAISDSVFEPRRIPTPVGNASTDRPNSLDLIGQGNQFLFNHNLILENVVYKGDTVFRPPDYEVRFTPVINYNETHVDEVGALKANPGAGRTRRETFVGVQALFLDVHLRNVSDRYDFDSVRVGIQPFQTDFRGFLFQDQQFGVRLFGTRDNNIFQYNLAWFRRLEKDTNSGLNDIGQALRDDDVYVANLYWQDFLKLGFVSQATIVHNRNREKGQITFDDNNFIARPASLGLERSRNYDVTYIGYNGDGHIDRLNLTASFYYAFGEESNGTFVNASTDISAFFAAIEASMDFDWTRVRLSWLHGSGDDDPFDDKAEGFDAIFENPVFAGADTSFFIRQAVPLIGGGRVALSTRNGILNNLRSSKELGQSNFTNPGINLLGVGADFDITPTFRFSFNINQLWFDTTEVLEAARNQAEIDKDIGLDVSGAVIYRPLATQNIVLRFSAAKLYPGQGYDDLFGDQSSHSVLANLLLMY